MRKKFWFGLVALLTFVTAFAPSLLTQVQSQVCQLESAVGQGIVHRNICLGNDMLQVAEHQFYYTVEGATAPQLVAQIQQRGPLWSDGNRYEAMHTWKMHRTFGVSDLGDRCVLSAPKIVVETSITLPQWHPPQGTSIDLVNNWDKYTTALKSHEEGHQAIALAAGREIEQRLRSFASYPSCVALRTAAKAAVAEILERCSLTQRDYDQKTQHGLAQRASYVHWLIEPNASEPS
jgi:predicted secreted Zn-dependent protease